MRAARKCRPTAGAPDLSLTNRTPYKHGHDWRISRKGYRAPVAQPRSYVHSLTATPTPPRDSGISY